MNNDLIYILHECDVHLRRMGHLIGFICVIHLILNISSIYTSVIYRLVGRKCFSDLA